MKAPPLECSVDCSDASWRGRMPRSFADRWSLRASPRATGRKLARSRAPNNGPVALLSQHKFSARVLTHSDCVRPASCKRRGDTLLMETGTGRARSMDSWIEDSGGHDTVRLQSHRSDLFATRSA